MKNLKERWEGALKDWRWWAMVIFIALCVWASYANTHENSGKTHSKGRTGFCYGWERVDDTMRLCFLDKEHIMCKHIVHNHGVWHESEPFLCEPEAECYDDNDNPTPFNLEQCEGG